jgi:hypothetical protein
MRGGGGSCGVSANEYSCAHLVTRHGAQINFGDPPPYLLTYGAYGFMLSGIVTTVLPPLSCTQKTCILRKQLCSMVWMGGVTKTICRG